MNDAVALNLPNAVVLSKRLAVYTYTRRMLSIVALLASLAALVLVVNNHRAYWFGHAKEKAPSDGLAAEKTQPTERSPTVTAADDTRYRAISDFVARRYRVSQEMAYDLVHLAHTVGRQHGLDPLLIIAIIAIESRFNPIAESIAGAKGLMQIIPRYHSDKLEEFGGEKAVFDPVANVKVGSRILKDYVRLTGNMGIALQMYAGALGDGNDHYTNRVLGEQRRLRQVLIPAVKPAAGAATVASTGVASRSTQSR